MVTLSDVETEKKMNGSEANLQVASPCEWHSLRGAGRLWGGSSARDCEMVIEFLSSCL